MNREPKLSEIEKLIKHFRDTEREHELLEVVERYKKVPDEPLETVEPETHEFHEEGVVLNKIAAKEGLAVYHHKPLEKYQRWLRGKKYLRYSFYFFLIFTGIMIFLNAPIIFNQVKSEEAKPGEVITVEELKEVKMAKSAPLAAGEVVPSFNQLVVPKIGVKAPIVFAKSNAESDIQENLKDGVVHYAGTANPGEVGNTFITGHSSNYWWIKGSYNYVFLNLGKLKRGDQAVIYYKKNKFIYSVTEVKTVSPKDLSVLEQGSTPTLTLMTCTPPGTNWKRLIVKLNQISPKYIKPKVVQRQVEVTDSSTLPSTDKNSVGAFFLSIWQEIVRALGFKD